MNMDNFNPDDLVDIAMKNQQSIFQAEMENGVPLNYLDERGQYVFRYNWDSASGKHGSVL